MIKVARLSSGTPTAVIIYQLLMSCLVVLISVVLFSVAGLIVASAATGVSTLQLASVDYSHASEAAINGIKILQVFSVLGIFIVPALVLPPIMFKANPLSFTGVNRYAPFIFFALAFLIYYTFVPFMELTIELNMRMKLPESMHGLEAMIKKMEESTNQVVARFLASRTASVFLVNTFVIALLPAFAEELFFRGFLQTILLRWWGRKHLAVILAAAIFSFIHFQFYGFLPRMLLGMLLGYLFLWSGDLKVPMLVHFLNNFTTLVQAWYMGVSVEQTNTFPAYTYVLSTAAAAFFLYYFYKRSRRRIAVPNLPGEDGQVSEKATWEPVFQTDNIQRAEVVAGHLRDEGIPAVVMNKRDSAYPSHGEIVVVVRLEDVVKARELIPLW